MRDKRPTRIVREQEQGLTLVELIVTVAILSILASAAVPVTMFTVKRANEHELRRDLWEMRDAIDAYKDAADKHAFQTKVDSQNYPPDLETLVNGVDVQAHSHRSNDRQAGVGVTIDAGRSDLRFLRRAERFRCVFQSPGNGPGRDEVFDVVGWLRGWLKV
jgi:prepilin-type N-terminal cleavage/methylation domain-containing protein